MALSDLIVSIRATANEWASDIKSIQREGKELERSLKPMKEAAQAVGIAFTAVGGAIVGTFVAAAKSAADYGDELAKASTRSGVSVEALARLRLAAEQGGSSFEGLTKGLTMLAKNMDMATTGSKQQRDAFQALGISVTDANGKLRPTSDVMLDIADKFSKMEDGTEKTAVALNIFGRAGAELIPTLNEGRDGLTAMGDTAERLGLVMSSDAAAAAEDFNDRLDDMQKATQGITMAVGSVFIPIMTDLFIKMTDVAASVRGWAADNQGLIKAIGAIGAGLLGAGGVLLGLTGVLTILPKLKMAFTLMTGPVGLTIAAFAALATGVIYFRKEIAIGLTAALATVVIGFEKMLGAVGSVARAVGMDGLASKIESAEETVASFRKGLDELVVAGMAEYGTLEKTKTQLDFERMSREAATEATIDHTFELSQNTEAAETARKKAVELKDEVYRLREGLEFSGQQALFKTTQSNVDTLLSELKTKTDTMVKAILDNLNYWKEGFKAWENAVTDSHKATTDLLEYNNKKVIDGVVAAHQKAKDEAKAAAEAQQKAYDDLFNDVKGTASRTFLAMFEDGKFQFSALGDTLKGIFFTAANEILSTMTAQLITPLVSRVTGALSGLLGNIPGLGGIFGGGVAGAASGVANTAGGAVSSVAGGASSMLGGLTTGLLGGVVGGVLSGIGSFLGGMRQEGTMNAVEENTRYTQIQLKDTMEQILWPMHNYIQWIAEQSTVLGHQLIPEIAYWGQLQIDAMWMTATENADRIVGALTMDGGNDSNQAVMKDVFSKLSAFLGGPASITINMDGTAVARILAPNFLALSRDENIQIIGTK